MQDQPGLAIERAGSADADGADRALCSDGQFGDQVMDLLDDTLRASCDVGQPRGAREHPAAVVHKGAAHLCAPEIDADRELAHGQGHAISCA